MKKTLELTLGMIRNSQCYGLQNRTIFFTWMLITVKREMGMSITVIRCLSYLIVVSRVKDSPLPFVIAPLYCITFFTLNFRHNEAVKTVYFGSLIIIERHNLLEKESVKNRSGPGRKMDHWSYLYYRMSKTSQTS